MSDLRPNYTLRSVIEEFSKSRADANAVGSSSTPSSSPALQGSSPSSLPQNSAPSFSPPSSSSALNPQSVSPSSSLLVSSAATTSHPSFSNVPHVLRELTLEDLDAAAHVMAQATLADPWCRFIFDDVREQLILSSLSLFSLFSHGLL